MSIALNIYYLRNAFNEPQEELADAVGVSKSAISNYENCFPQNNRVPKKEVLEKIANHFFVRVEDLEKGDFSDIEKFRFDLDYLRKSIDVYFPIIKTDEVMENTHFRRAYRYHTEIYECLQNDIYGSALPDFDRCINEYMKVGDGGSIKPEAAANILAINNLIGMSCKGILW